MTAYRRFRDIRQFGPVQVASFFDGRGRERHATACTAPRCDFSTEYDNRSAAELAARTHRCPA
ncbi:SpdB protein [Streptomyces longisporoflavus]|uniref:mobile element transfer protein n=1 Tax=Streptomyces longisporoflavus TaxID=28044 RepID=UPI00167CFB76|nr:mobile element transfer protein [Streptomyces longisporoflavus]GGV49845.1 SpdB protein [Streptomyces longisporoflavus]